MTTFRRLLLVVCVVAAVECLTSTPSFAQRVFTLGSIGIGSVFGTAINADGVVVGIYIGPAEVAGGQFELAKAFIWTRREGLRPLASTQGSNAHAYDINDDGVIVGDHGGWPAIWRNGELEMLPVPVSGSATTINNAGQVAGVTSVEGYPYLKPWAWDEVRGFRFLSIPPELGGAAIDMNEAGQIAGWAQYQAPYGTSGLQAVRWETDGTLTFIPAGNLGGPNLGFAANHEIAINDAGVVAGQWHPPTGGLDRAFLWDAGTPASLPPLWDTHCGALGILDDIVVGKCDYVPVVWHHGVVESLAAIGNGAMAFAVSRNGWVLGTYDHIQRRYVHSAIWRLFGVGAKDVAAEFDRPFQLRADLYAMNQPSAGKEIQFSLNGVVVGTAITDAEGVAALSIASNGLPVGTYRDAIVATFPGDADSPATTSRADLVVGPRTAILDWPSPAPMFVGQPLGSAQLNATADVLGTFDYSPGPGSVLSLGLHYLSVTFTPSDTIRYNGWTTTTPITVNLASTASRPEFVSQMIAVGGGDYGYATNSSNGAVYSVSPAGTVERLGQPLSIALPDGGLARGVAIDSQRDVLYVTDTNRALLWRFDAETGGGGASISLPAPGAALTVDVSSGRVYVLVPGEPWEGRDYVAIVDPAIPLDIATVSVAPCPIAVTLDPARKRLFVASAGTYCQAASQTDSRVSVIDVDASHAGTVNSVVATFAGGIGAFADVAVNHITGNVYVTHHEPDERVRVFRPLATGAYEELPSIRFDSGHPELAHQAAGIALNTSKNLLYAHLADVFGAGEGINTLTAFDLTTGEIRSIALLDPNYYQYQGRIAVNAANGTIYVGNTLNATTILRDAMPVTVATSPAQPSISTADVSIAFQTVTGSGATTIQPLEVAELNVSMPGQFSLENGAAYEVSTTASFSGAITLCFNASYVADPGVFSALHVLHGEGGTFVDRTSSRDFSTGLICATVSSLSPFVIARSTAPAYTIATLYDVRKSFKAGSTVPVRLQIADSAGVNRSSSSVILHAVEIVRVANSASSAVVDAGNANADQDFRFDAGTGGGGGYIFNLKTTGLTTGSYELRFTVGAGSRRYVAPFQIR